MKKTKLFLDDIRMPQNAVKLVRPYYKNTYLQDDWHVVRNYDSFCDWIRKNGLPDLISFDHDLHQEHMNDYYKNQANGIPIIEYETFRQKTGLDCAKWLVVFCVKNDLKLPECKVHSANPIGRLNIKSYLKESKEGLNL